MGKTGIGGLSDSCVTLDNAILCVPGQDRGSGVLAADGTFCDFSRGYFGPNRALPTPRHPGGRLPRIAGTHLYAGWLRPHFGHFLMESIQRLWALDTLAEAVDSVLFAPFRPGIAEVSLARYGGFLDLLTGEVPLRIAESTCEVERLIVPDPGVGHGTRLEGSPRYRAFVRAAVARGVVADGPERLYISRSAFRKRTGGVLGEERIEALLEANGFEIFHPQRHPMEVQLARYAAARELIAVDGSALHLAALALQPGARVGLIARRRGTILSGLARQIEVFSGAEVHVLDALRTNWVAESRGRIDCCAIGELDFPRLARRLAAAGFIERAGGIEDIAPAQIEAMVRRVHDGPVRAVPMAV